MRKDKTRDLRNIHKHAPDRLAKTPIPEIIRTTFHFFNTCGSTSCDSITARQSCRQLIGLPSSRRITQKLPSAPRYVNRSTSTHPLNNWRRLSHPPMRMRCSSLPPSDVADEGRGFVFTFIASSASWISPVSRLGPRAA